MYGEEFVIQFLVLCIHFVCINSIPPATIIIKNLLNKVFCCIFLLMIIGFLLVAFLLACVASSYIFF
jgi:hypothetical protein